MQRLIQILQKQTKNGRPKHEREKKTIIRVYVFIIHLYFCNQNCLYFLWKVDGKGALVISIGIEFYVCGPMRGNHLASDSDLTFQRWNLFAEQVL